MAAVPSTSFIPEKRIKKEEGLKKSFKHDLNLSEVIK